MKRWNKTRPALLPVAKTGWNWPKIGEKKKLAMVALELNKNFYCGKNQDP